MSYRSKRARLAQASKAKEPTTQSVDDTIAQVIKDVADGDHQSPENLLGSSCNLSTTTDQPSMTHQKLVQSPIMEEDDDLSNQRNASARLPPTSSLSEPLSSAAARQLRASKRQSLQRQESSANFTAEETLANGTQVNSHHNNWADDPAFTTPAQASTRNANDAGDLQRNAGGRQRRTPPPSQLLTVDSPDRQPFWEQDDDGEPAHRDSAQVRGSKQAKWNDDIEFDETEEVEMRDSEGRRGKKGGKILPRHVWSLQPGVRFVVRFNALDQPVGKGGHVLVRFLGDVAKSGELCPIGDLNWHKVDKSHKADIVALVRDKFVLPDRVEVDKSILKHVGKTWRMYRHSLMQQYKKPGRTQEQVASAVPKGVIPNQWKKLVEYWFSDKYEFLSTRGKEARAALSHLHTSGSKSFAQKREEFEKTHGREPGSLEWFVQTHRRKDGTFADNSTKDFLDAATSMVAQRALTSSSTQRVAIENQVFDELMYPNDESYRRPIGYGFGASKNKVFGLGAELRKRGLAESLTALRSKKRGVGGEPKASGHMESGTSSEVERLKFAFAAMSEDNELMQSQILMQSQQLQMQSQQMQMQSQQIEGLRFQLQHVTSLLTKFGVMMNKPPVKTAPRGVPRLGVSFANSQVRDAPFEASGGDSDSSEWESD